MSAGTKPQVLLPAYDAQDLRRRMLVCFTIGELFNLAAKLQVPQVPSWSNNPQEAARDIVRHFERSGALAFLVEALREAKPLVEWPEPLPLPVPPAPPLAPPSSPIASPVPTASSGPQTAPATPQSPVPTRGAPATGAAGGSTILGVPAPQALEYADTALEAPDARGDRPTPITDVPAAMIEAATRGPSAPPAGPAPTPGFAPAIMPRPGEKPLALEPAPAPAPTVPEPPSRPEKPAPSPPLALSTQAVSSAQPPSSSAPLQDPLRTAARPGAAWPGTTAASDTSNKLPDPRVLMAIGAGIILVLIGIAFLAGRASSGPTASASGTTTTTGAPGSDPVPIAQVAADALGASLLRVAKACQIDPSTLRGRSLFEVAYLRCGPVPELPSTPTNPAPRPPNYDPLSDPDPGQPVTDPTSSAGPKSTRPAGKTTKPPSSDTPSPSLGGGGGCLSSCQKSHSGCISRCGPEPKQGSEYNAYVSCHSGCLKALSQCKMSCN